MLDLLIHTKPALRYDIDYMRYEHLREPCHLTLRFGDHIDLDIPYLNVSPILRMVYIRAQHARDQEFINRKLRPKKIRFPRGRIPGARDKMELYGINRLRYFKPRIEYR